MPAPNYNSAASLRAFLEAHGLGMRKKFGQNFLINPAVRQALVDALDADSDVWEIGPGLGAMTALLLEKGLSVRAFEIDPGFIRILKELFSGDTHDFTGDTHGSTGDRHGSAGDTHVFFTLVEGDVLKTWPSQPPSRYLLGNLPYNIAATLLAQLIEQERFFKRIVVTVQREVALRMAAAAGSPDYSSFSVLCSSAYRVQPLMVIKSASFYPRPNVDSQAVLLERREDALTVPSCFYPLVRQLFSSRRKTIKNNLTGFFASRNYHAKPAEAAAEALEACALNGSNRAEALTLDEFLALAKVIDRG